MRHPFRVLPVTMLVAFLLLGLKIGEVVRDGHTLIVSFGGEAQAQQAPAKPAETPAKPEDKAAKPEEKPAAADAKKPATSDDDADTEEAPKREFSQVEIDILQSLAKRRQELDDWAKQIQLKENMLIATEQRLNEKIDNLEKMKKELETLLAQYNEQEDTKIRSLVKIYENMKPKDAARIFEELDMPVLLTVVDKMSERKVSPILAAMNPTKAKDVTVQLAEQRKLQKSRVGGTVPTADAAAAAPNAGASAPATAANTPPAAATR